MKEKKEEGAATNKDAVRAEEAETPKLLLHLLADPAELIRFRHISKVNTQQLLDKLAHKLYC